MALTLVVGANRRASDAGHILQAGFGCCIGGMCCAAMTGVVVCHVDNVGCCTVAVLKQGAQLRLIIHGAIK